MQNNVIVQYCTTPKYISGNLKLAVSWVKEQYSVQNIGLFSPVGGYYGNKQLPTALKESLGSENST